MKNQKHSKNHATVAQRIETTAAHIGMTVMTLATVVSMTELAIHEGARIVSAMQPALAFATEQSNANGQGHELNQKNSIQQKHGDEQMRRGSEEIRHTSATYGSVMRSHPVSGTL